MTDQILNIELPTDVPSVFADFASLWHTPDVFVMDFISITTPPAPAEGPDGEQVTAAQARVVQRVKIPPKQVFELMKALEQQLSAWETENR